jgi:2-succinyl-5-enolpyruvyl-6-hydroxy-3-cyclohexene-1-carboxylate synthase
VLAEPSSPLWVDPAGGHLLRAAPWVLGAVLDAPDDHPLRPDHVVVLGRPTLHRGVSRLLADPRVTVHAVPSVAPGPPGRARPGWTDVQGTVTAVGALPDPAAWAPDPAFATAWVELDTCAAEAADATRSGDDGTALAAAVVAALPAGALLVIGSSNPVRDVALGAAPRAGIAVLSARGVSGIDGAISLATGAALAHGGPTVALLGDLTFVHDAGGLLAGPHEPRAELTVVVANDDGGGIFSVLEQGAPPHAAAFERVFGTPHGTDLAALCRAHGVVHHRLGPGTPDLATAFAPREVGTRVLEVPVDRADRREAHRRAGAAAVEVLTGRMRTPRSAPGA